MLTATDVFHVLAIAGIGLLAGMLGGLLGVGGSVIIIPGLTWLLGFQQHLYQAAAMIANVAVSVPATLRHRRAGALVPRVLIFMLPAAVGFIILGVWISNLPIFHGSGARWLGRMLAVFLLYEMFNSIVRLFKTDRVTGGTEDQPTITAPRSITAGAGMGLTGGLLGVGGGIIAVPLQLQLIRLPLRQCIANSAAAMCISASVGAIYKNLSLSQHGHPWWQGIGLAMLLAPTCWLGGHLGAQLTHRLSLWKVRVVFIILMGVAAWKMAAIG